ncbi:MFS transporter [Microbacteriaceae bacterium VKM Ac-2854]|nr:MFS transporter [Microbacteriaceae bacterium VKM Ac-2854]
MDVGRGIYDRRYLLTTLGTTALVFLGAFEALAVTTVMPLVSRDLDGRELYSLAFAATLAASVVGMVAAGASADRRGPTPALAVSVVLFTAGLILAGTATDMTVFVGARFLQGLGSGGVNVTLYVLVARVYPPQLHPRIFGAFAAAWVVPSMVGPFAAGLVAETFSWHWVFLGVVGLVVVSAGLIAPALRGHAVTDRAPFDRSALTRGALAIVVALAVVAVSSSGEWGGSAWLVALPAAVILLLAVRPLLPAGTLLARGPLPATILLRASVAAAFFGTEVYLPLLLHDRYGLPSWLSGLTLMAGAVAWALGSALQARATEQLGNGPAMRWGAMSLFGGVAVVLLTVLLAPTPAIAAIVAAAGWFFAGAGMGIVYPRMSSLTLALSPTGREGFNSSALQIADSVGGATSLALSGLVFTALGFAATFGYGALIAALAVLLSLRVARLLR